MSMDNHNSGIIYEKYPTPKANLTSFPVKFQLRLARKPRAPYALVTTELGRDKSDIRALSFPVFNGTSVL